MDVDESQVKWVTLEELKASPIPTGLKKALKLLEKFKVITFITHIAVVNQRLAVDHNIHTAEKESCCQEDHEDGRYQLFFHEKAVGHVECSL